MRGKKSDLPEAVSEQIRTMRAEGQKPKAIIRFIKENYGIEVPVYKIYSTGRAKAAAGPGAGLKKKETPVLSDNPIQDIKNLLSELHQLYLGCLGDIRQELIEKCAQLRAVKKD